MKSVYHTKTPEATMKLGEKLASRLKPGAVVLLFGDLGSGKTHFSKGFALGLGIDQVIKSPTFTYVNNYQISGQRSAVSGQSGAKLTTNHSPLTTLHHYDLYRLTPGDSFHSIGLEETLNDPQAINLIEWADRLGDHLPKTHVRVDFRVGPESHEVSIQFNDIEVVPEWLVQGFWEEWATPLHVRDHCRQVARVALHLGEAFVRQNIFLDLNLLETAALLHDMARVCDFTDLDPSKFKEEITEEKWAKWVRLREQFSAQNHADIASDFLVKLGYFKTAELIRLHHSLSLLDESEKFESLETALLYYADKRVRHDEVVSLTERFEDGRVRYGDHDDEERKKKYLEVEKASFELEKKIFDQIDLGPEDIKI